MVFLFDMAIVLTEQAVGACQGDTLTLSWRGAYGERREDFSSAPKKYFRDAKHLQPGMHVVLNTKDGHRSVTVLKVGPASSMWT